MTRTGTASVDLKELSRATAMDLLARRLRIVRVERDKLPSPELLAESIREVVFRYALNGERQAPVHVRTVLNQVRRQLAPIWPDLSRGDSNEWMAPEFVRESENESQETKPAIRVSLDLLAEVGDVQHVGAGYWVPTPVRLVKLSDDADSRVLILGGTPLYQLFTDGYLSVEICGSVRSLPLRILPSTVRKDDTVWQHLDDWLGAPTEQLLNWAGRLLRRASAELLPSHSDLEAFEVYDPKSHPRESQFFRWTPARLYVPTEDGLSLCRTATPSGTGPRRYWIGRLSHRAGSAQVVSEYGVAPRDARRLQYAFDALAAAPTKVTAEYGPRHAEVTITSYLPQPEQRLLVAVGEECSAKPGRLPLRFRVSRDVAEPVMDYISRLGVQWR